MSFVLVFTPAGRVTASASSNVQGRPLTVDTGDNPDRQIARVAKAFASSQAEGLFSLATAKLDATLSPSLVYWRSFAVRYLTELCQTSGTSLRETPAQKRYMRFTSVVEAAHVSSCNAHGTDELVQTWF